MILSSSRPILPKNNLLKCAPIPLLAFFQWKNVQYIYLNSVSDSFTKSKGGLDHFNILFLLFLLSFKVMRKSGILRQSEQPPPQQGFFHGQPPAQTQIPTAGRKTHFSIVIQVMMTVSSYDSYSSHQNSCGNHSNIKFGENKSISCGCSCFHASCLTLLRAFWMEIVADFSAQEQL